MSELSNLIAEIEKAEAGSRELDARILCASLGDDWYVKNQYEDGSGKWLCYSRTRFIDRDKRHPQCKGALRYTTSIDAALTLVPEGHITELVQSRFGAWWDAYVSRQEAPAKWRLVGETDDGIKTPALALCIASLKAREAGQ